MARKRLPVKGIKDGYPKPTILKDQKGLKRMKKDEKGPGDTHGSPGRILSLGSSARLHPKLTIGSPGRILSLGSSARLHPKPTIGWL